MSGSRVAPAIFTTVSAQALASAAIVAPTAIAPLLALALGVPVVLVGVFVSLVYASAAVSAAAAGPMVMGIGGVRFSQACLIASAVGLACVATGWIWIVALGAVLIGAGYGPLAPASADVLTRAIPPRRASLAYSVKQSGTPLGGFLVGAIVPGLALALGWQVALLATAAACVFVSIAYFAFVRDLDGSRSGPRLRANARAVLDPIRFVLADPGLRTLAAASFLFAITQASLTTYVVAFLTDLRWPLVTAGFALAMVQAGGTFGRIFWGWLADTAVGPRATLTLLSAGMGLCSLAVVAVAAPTPHWAVLILSAIYGMTAVGWSGVFVAAVARAAPQDKAAFVTGGALGVTFSGIVVGPPVFGAMAAVAGNYQFAFAALAVPLFVCAWRLSTLKSLLPKMRD